MKLFIEKGSSLKIDENTELSYLTINIFFNYFATKVRLHLENNIIRLSYLKEKEVEIMPLLLETENKIYETKGYK